jgi:hypothetical protein
MISRDNKVMSNYEDFLEQTDPDIWTSSGNDEDSDFEAGDSSKPRRFV